MVNSHACALCIMNFDIGLLICIVDIPVAIGLVWWSASTGAQGFSNFRWAMKYSVKTSMVA